MVVEKAGLRGCLVHATDLPTSIRGHKVEAVDVTAAGDSFGAGFGVGMLRGLSPEAAAKQAKSVCAAKVQKLSSG